MVRPSPRREDILRAARAVFIESGAQGARMDDIARRAGVSKGAVYHHFPSKDELFAALCEQEHSRLAGMVDQIVGMETDAVDKLRALTRGFAHWFGSLEHPPRFFLLMGDAAARDPELQAHWIRIHDRLVARLSKVIDQGIAEGSLRAVDPVQVARLLKAVSDGTAMRTAIAGEAPQRPDEMVDLLLRGMLAP